MTWLHVLGLAVVSGLWLLWARQRTGRDLDGDYRPPTLRQIRGGRR